MQYHIPSATGLGEEWKTMIRMRRAFGIQKSDAIRRSLICRA
jgi:hypothetical protein